MSDYNQVGWPLFVENQRLILAVTEWLNNNSAVGDSDFYLDVRLCSSGTGTVVGVWSDEIAPDAWSFQQTNGTEEG